MTTLRSIHSNCEYHCLISFYVKDNAWHFVCEEKYQRLLRDGREGIFNLAGDGALSLKEIAELLGKPYHALPAGLIRAALRVLKPLGLSPYGPEQVDFLRYRPVLNNRRLKQEFGFSPRYSSREAFLAFLRAQGI